MKKLTEMIAIKGTGPQKAYYMKVIYCPKCGDEFTIPLVEGAPRCRDCKRKMQIKWLEIDEPDYTEHKANYHKVRRDSPDVGKNPKKYF